MATRLTAGVGVLILSACGGGSPSSSDQGGASGIIKGRAASTATDRGAKSVVMILGPSGTRPDDIDLCTGVLIGPSTVLTAAHCFDAKGFNWGDFHNKPDSDLGLIAFAADPKTRRPIKKWLVHPKYVGEKWLRVGSNFLPRNPYDLAVLQFEGTRPADSEIARMKSLTVKDIVKKSFQIFGYGLRTTDEAEVARWNGLFTHGRDAVINALDLQTVSKTASYDRLYEYGFVIDQRDQPGVCNGDSGGPAFIEKDGETLLVGLVSHRSGRFKGPSDEEPVKATSHICQGESVLTRATMFQNWIRETVRLLEKDDCSTMPLFRKRLAQLRNADESDLDIRLIPRAADSYRVVQHRPGTRQVIAYTVQSDSACRVSVKYSNLEGIAAEAVQSEFLKTAVQWSKTEKDFTPMVLKLDPAAKIGDNEIVRILNERRGIQRTDGAWTSWPVEISADLQLRQKGAPAEAWDLFGILGVQDQLTKTGAQQLAQKGRLELSFHEYSTNADPGLQREIWIEDPRTQELLVLSRLVEE